MSLPHRTSVVRNGKMTELIGVLSSANIGQRTSVRENEDENADLSVEENIFRHKKIQLSHCKTKTVEGRFS